MLIWLNGRSPAGDELAKSFLLGTLASATTQR